MSSKGYIFKRCENISAKENESLKVLVGGKKEVFASCVVQVFLTDETRTDWIKHATGILCFVKDHTLESYFFRLFDIHKRCLIWEDQIYQNFHYVKEKPFFHSFEGKNCVVGFNFAFPKEAKLMKREVYKYDSVVYEKEKSIWKKIIPEPKKKNINKNDIGSPICFEHLAHTGLNNSFNISDNPMIAEILKEAGINNIHMRDNKTREMVYSVLIENMENVKRKIKRKAPPPPTTPNSIPKKSSDTNSPIKPQRTSPKHNINIPVPPPMENLPTIPVPPPLQNATSIPACPAMANFSNEVKAIPKEIDNRSALLESIRNGRKLKPVETNSTPKTSINDDDRSNMIKILKDVLSKREKALQSSSDESNSDDDCEWDA